MISVRSSLVSLAAFALALGCAATVTAQPPAGRPQKARLELFAERTAAAPGETTGLVARVTVDSGWHIQAHVPTYDYLIPTELTLPLPAGWRAAAVQYPPPVRWKAEFADEALDVYAGTVRMVAEIQPPAGAGGTVSIAASLRYQACDEKSCLPPTTAEAELALPIAAGGTATNPEEVAAARSGLVASAPKLAAGSTPAAPGTSGPSTGLAGILLLALAGGLILNAMPCVLPILSLKVFGLVKSAGRSRAAVTGASLATAAGILISFWALAGAAIAARSAGAAVGWGIQFQEPGFVAFLLVVVALFSFNLWGLFEVPLPQRLARLGDSAAREGVAGHLASGLFATLMATPCSAPFLGTAISFALVRPAAEIVAVFTAVGLGMALPYLALAVAPGAARFLPKPGAWMDTLRGAMGFLLAGAAIWLLYVLGSQITAERVAAIELGLLILGLFTWLHHRAAGGTTGARLAAFGMVAALVGIVWLAIGAPAPVQSRALAGASDTGIAWQRFDRAAAEGLAREGRWVFVDVTADWCFTCKANEKLVLDTAEVAAAFARRNVVAMKADWTNRDEAIARFLADHGRYGIPFYVLYRPGREPLVMSELLSKSAVLDAFAAAP
jgi:suppressor for copper-sensitivity B